MSGNAVPEVKSIRTVSITLIARDDVEAEMLMREIEASGLLNDWPCFAWDDRDATPEEIAWLHDEYDEALRMDDADL